MNHNIVSGFPRKCSKCRIHRTVEDYSRRGEIWRTCNDCSAKATARRKKETADANLAIGQDNVFNLRAAQMSRDQQEAVNAILQLQQEYSERHRQLQVQQHSQEQQDAPMALEPNFLVDDQIFYDSPSPLEQSSRSMYYAQHYVDPQPLYSNTKLEEMMLFPEAQTEWHQEFPQMQSSPSISVPCYEGMVSDPEVFDLDLFVGLDALTDPAQCDQEFTFADDNLLDFDQLFADALASGDLAALPEVGVLNSDGGSNLVRLHDRTDAMDLDPNNDSDMDPQLYNGGFAVMEEDPMDIDVGHPAQGGYTVTAFPQSHSEVLEKPARKPREKLPVVNIDAYFADFDASEDVFHQPTSPKHNLEGEALAKHLVHEIGLASRLLELHGRLLKIRSPVTFLETVKAMALDEECERISPWGPLSDWLAVYEGQYEDILDRYGFGTSVSSIAELEWRVKNKFKAEKAALTHTLRKDLRKEATTQIENSAKALLKTLVQLTGQNDVQAVTIALKKKLRQMKVPGQSRLFME